MLKVIKKPRNYKMLLSNYSGNKFEAGCDEVGRGCLAGPVVAAAVIFPKSYKNEAINDSKKIAENKRNELFEIIKKDAISFGISFIPNEIIDKINILNASFLAMHKAIDQLEIIPGFLIIDGNKFKPYQSIPYECIVKGDGKFLSIAAASILAKTARDNYMKALGAKYPGYKWEKNVGYPTKDHINYIKEKGFTKYHRRSFHIKSLQLKLY